VNIQTFAATAALSRGILHSNEEIIQDQREGTLVIIMDDGYGENEGGLLLTAEKGTPQAGPGGRPAHHQRGYEMIGCWRL